MRCSRQAARPRLVAAASATWLSGASGRAFTRSALVLAEALLARLLIVGHRALCQVATLVRLHDHTARSHHRDDKATDKALHCCATITPLLARAPDLGVHN